MNFMLKLSHFFGLFCIPILSWFLLVFYLSQEIPSLWTALVFCNSIYIVFYKHLHLPAEHHLKGWHLGCLLLCSSICEQHWRQVFIPVILCIIHHLNLWGQSGESGWIFPWVHCSVGDRLMWHGVQSLSTAAAPPSPCSQTPFLGLRWWPHNSQICR